MTDKGQEGKYGMPHGQFAILTIIILVLLAGIIMGELHKVDKVLACLPILMSRSGRGILIFAIGLITCCHNPAVLGLSIIAMIVGIFNIFLGMRDDPISLDHAYSSTGRDSNVEMQSRSKPNTKAS